MARTGAAAASRRTIIPGTKNRKPRRFPVGVRSGRPLRQPEFPLVPRTLSTLRLRRPYCGRIVRARARPCAGALRRFVRTCCCSGPRARRLRSHTSRRIPVVLCFTPRWDLSGLGRQASMTAAGRFDIYRAHRRFVGATLIWETSSSAPHWWSARERIAIQKTLVASTSTCFRISGGALCGW